MDVKFEVAGSLFLDTNPVEPRDRDLLVTVANYWTGGRVDLAAEDARDPERGPSVNLALRPREALTLAAALTQAAREILDDAREDPPHGR